jgi:hypothetical protein
MGVVERSVGMAQFSQQLIDGTPNGKEIPQNWESGLPANKKVRTSYLLYP